MNYIEGINLLESGKLSGLVFLYGEEAYLIDFFINVLKEELVAEGFEALNYDKIDGNVSMEKIRVAGETLPFMGGQRLVEIRGVDFSRESASKNKDLLEELQDYAKEVSDHVVMVFVSESGKFFKGGFYKKIKDQAHIINMEALNQNQFYSFIGKELSSKGIKVSKQVISYIGQRSGYLTKDLDIDLYDVTSQLDKIGSSTRTSQLSIEDVDALMSEDIVTNIFDFTDALTSKQRARATKLLMNILDKDMNEGYRTFFMVVRQFRNLLNVKVLSQSKLSNKDIMARLGIKNFEFNKLMNFQKSYSLKELKEIYKLLYEIEFNLKSSKADERDNLLYLINSI